MTPAAKKLTEYTEAQELDIAGLMMLPGVACNNCPASESCPVYMENAECGLDQDLQGLSTRDVENVLPTLELLADLQKKRALRGAMLEARVAGGQLDMGVTRQIEIAAQAVERVARFKGAGQQQGSTQSLTIVAKQEAGGGLLSRLMAGVAPQALPEAPVHIQAEVVEMPQDVAEHIQGEPKI